MLSAFLLLSIQMLSKKETKEITKFNLDKIWLIRIIMTKIDRLRFRFSGCSDLIFWCQFQSQFDMLKKNMMRVHWTAIYSACSSAQLNDYSDSAAWVPTNTKYGGTLQIRELDDKHLMCSYSRKGFSCLLSWINVWEWWNIGRNGLDRGLAVGILVVVEPAAASRLPRHQPS